MQQINVREVGLVRTVRDIEDTVITAKNGTPLRVKDIATVSQGPKIRLGQFGRAIHRADGKIIDNGDVVSGIVLMRKGAEFDATLEGVHRKVQELNEHILPPGVKIVPFNDRSDLVHYTTHTVLHNLTEGFILVTVVLLLFLGNVQDRAHRRLTIPFSLLFASICLDLRHIPANLLSLGAFDFGMVVDGAVVMVENIIPPLGPQSIRLRQRSGSDSGAAHEVQRPVFYAMIIIISGYLPIFTLQRVEGRLFRPMAWTVAFALLGAILFSMTGRAGAGKFSCFARKTPEWQNPVVVWVTKRLPAGLDVVHPPPLGDGRRYGARPVRELGYGSAVIGSEFLPHLDEGAIWVRGTLAPSTGPSEGIRVANQARVILASFPEVTVATSQVGRPDDGSDFTGFFNTEYCVNLKPKGGVASRLPPG